MRLHPGHASAPPSPPNTPCRVVSLTQSTNLLIAADMTPAVDDEETLSGLAATERLASRLSRIARLGDIVCLSGELGTGKTTFARSFIRSRASRAGIEISEVPSPTFTLVQTYEMPQGDIWHFDLFRLEHPGETLELGIGDALNGGICLVEWPDRLPEDSLGARLDLAFAFGTTEDERHVKIVGDAAWRGRLAEFIGNE